MESIKTISGKMDWARSAEARFYQRSREYQDRLKIGDLDLTGRDKLGIAVKAVYKWAERKKAGHKDASLVIVGPQGTGKTHIAKAVLWSITSQAITEAGEPIDGAIAPLGRFYTADDLIQTLTPEVRVGLLAPSGNAYSESIPLVVIDDIGTEQTIPYVSSQDNERRARWFKFINHCYRWQISLIITSNLDFRALRDWIGPRSWDRLAEMAPKGFMIELFGIPSYRIKISGRGD